MTPILSARLLSAPRHPARRVLALAAIALTAVLASCAAPPPPAPPPPPPSIGLSPVLVEQASAYRSYMDHAISISPGFTDGASVAQGVRTGAAYEPKRFLRGAVAYGAIVALQDPGFVAGIRSFAGDADRRREVAYGIMKDPAYVVGISGSAGAAGLVITALGADGRRLLDQGKAVKQAAYDVQHQAWSKSDVSGRDARLQLAKQLSATPHMGEVAQTARLQSAVAGGGDLGVSGAQAVSPPYTPLVIRSLAVAALSALGYATDANMEQLTPLMLDPNGATCLNMSKLNLYQCLAVSKPNYEDVFCLGQHIMIDTGRCVMKGAGIPEPVDVRPAPLNIAAATPVVRKPSKGAKSKKR